MKLFLIAAFVAVAAAVGSADASAQNFGNTGFLPYGFYQPYGAQYGTSIRTPPYFATNPPVYYGTRHARPYGLSPFASPPLVQAGPGYQSRLRDDFLEPIVPTPAPYQAPSCNPCIHHSRFITKPTETKLGAIQTNPFVEPVERIANNEA